MKPSFVLFTVIVLNLCTLNFTSSKYILGSQRSQNTKIHRLEIGWIDGFYRKRMKLINYDLTQGWANSKEEIDFENIKRKKKYPSVNI